MDNKEDENYVYMDVKTNKEDIITTKKKHIIGMGMVMI